MSDVLLGYEVGTGAEVSIPIRHLAVTGQTRESGKTTTLEALIGRAGRRALTFVTKRGEIGFDGGRRIRPYFRDRADWQFVTSIIDATLQEKNKFLRPWIMRICRTTRTLADVQRAVRAALLTAKGINEGVYTQLDAYLELIVPEIQRADLAKTLDLDGQLNVMDVSDYALPMQMLFVQSALDWVNERGRDTVVVVPEAWEFIPEGRGSPVKASAIALVRKGGAIGNLIWVDSQDMAGVDKTVLRGCAVWLIGVQREANEIKRNLANIPAGIGRPSAADVATLERGQFFVCHGRTVRKVYVQPAWMTSSAARNIALGKIALSRQEIPVPPPAEAKPEEDEVNKKEAEALRADNDRLRGENQKLETMVTNLQRRLDEHEKRYADGGGAGAAPAPFARVQSAGPMGQSSMAVDVDALYAEIKRRIEAEPGLLRLVMQKPAIEVTVERPVVEMDGSTLKGRIACLLAAGFYDDGATNSGTRAELKRTGADANNANIGRALSELLRDGFVTLESGDRFRAVKGMKVQIRERKAA